MATAVQTIKNIHEQNISFRKSIREGVNQLGDSFKNWSTIKDPFKSKLKETISKQTKALDLSIETRNETEQAAIANLIKELNAAREENTCPKCKDGNGGIAFAERAELYGHNSEKWKDNSEIDINEPFVFSKEGVSSDISYMQAEIDELANLIEDAYNDEGTSRKELAKRKAEIQKLFIPIAKRLLTMDYRNLEDKASSDPSSLNYKAKVLETLALFWVEGDFDVDKLLEEDSLKSSVKPTKYLHEFYIRHKNRARSSFEPRINKNLRKHIEASYSNETPCQREKAEEQRLILDNPDTFFKDLIRSTRFKTQSGKYIELSLDLKAELIAYFSNLARSSKYFNALIKQIQNPKA